MKQKILILSCLIVFNFVITSCKNDAIEVTVSEGTNMAAALSPDKSTLAISLQGTIWTIPVEGGKAKSVTDEMGDSQEPDWSPDGEKIVFHSYRDGTYHIWTINKDGSDLTQLTSGISDNREPDWSPDGKSVVFASDRSGNYDIWQIDLSSKELKQLTSDKANDSNPAFSNSGTKIAFVSQRAESGIYILENGTEKLAVSEAMRIAAPSWNADDSKLSYVAFTGKTMLFDDKNTSYIYLANLNDGSTEQISTGDEDLFPFRINWAADNKLIYTADGHIRKRIIGQSTIETIPFEATFTLNRKPYEKKKYDFDNTEDHKALGIASPVVSDDGKKIAFAAKGDIFIQEIDGKLIQLTNDSFVDLEPDWSPDGNTLAYISDRGGIMNVWLHDLKTNQSRLLSKQIIEDTSYPTWSPDGKKIAYYTQNYMKKWGYGILHIADVASGEVKVANKTVWVPSKPSWSPDGKTVAMMALKAHSTRFREGFNNFMLVSLEKDTAILVSPDSDKPLGMRVQNGPAWSPDGKTMAYTKDGTLGLFR
jgi:Tol biopolymer transport system component